MNHLRLVMSGLLLAAILSLQPAGQTVKQNHSGARARQSTVKAQSNNRAAPNSARQRALAMLDSLWLATEAAKLSMDKVSLQARIADTLWCRDESRARLRFNDVLQRAAAVEEEQRKDSTYGAYVTKFGLRSTVLKWIVKRDPAWAKQLMQDYLNSNDTKGTSPLLLMRLADVDAPQAVKVMKQMLDKKELPWLSQQLNHLRVKDASQADDLFSYAMAAGSQDGEASFKYLLELFGHAFPSGKASDMSSPLSPELLKRFLDFGYKAMMQEADAVAQEVKESRRMNERADNSYANVVGLMPYFERYAPDAATKISARWDEMILALEDGKRAFRKIKVVMGARSIQQALNNAEQATDPKEKELSYMIAIKKAADAGDIKQALSLLGRLDDSGREESEDQVRQLALNAIIDSGDADTAYRYGKRLKDPDGRAEFLVKVAQLLCAKNQRARATAVLNEAQRTAEEEGEEPPQAMDMLAIANVATCISPAKGFEAMKKAVGAINRVTDEDGKPAATVGEDKFDENLLVLAAVDFDRALALAKSITEKEVSVTAQVAVCRGVLLQKESSHKDKTRQ